MALQIRVLVASTLQRRKKSFVQTSFRRLFGAIITSLASYYIFGVTRSTVDMDIVIKTASALPFSSSGRTSFPTCIELKIILKKIKKQTNKALCQIPDDHRNNIPRRMRRE